MRERGPWVAQALAAMIAWGVSPTPARANPGSTLQAISSATVLKVAKRIPVVPETPKKQFKAVAARCPRKRAHCFDLHVHVVRDDGHPVQTPAWLAAEIEVANDLFAAIDVGFRVGQVSWKDAAFADVQTRKQRDKLGRTDHGTGPIHVYMVRRLADVDIAGAVIRGVHWRDRADTSRRWVIVSAIGSKMVLAHELGHFFGLPHSKYEVSIMNKTPRPLPKWPDRVFAKPEVKKMARRRDAMIGDGTLTDRRG